MKNTKNTKTEVETWNETKWEEMSIKSVYCVRNEKLLFNT